MQTICTAPALNHKGWKKVVTFFTSTVDIGISQEQTDYKFFNKNQTKTPCGLTNNYECCIL